jgi:hypothetical protein
MLPYGSCEGRSVTLFFDQIIALLGYISVLNSWLLLFLPSCNRWFDLSLYVKHHLYVYNSRCYLYLIFGVFIYFSKISEIRHCIV